MDFHMHGGPGPDFGPGGPGRGFGGPGFFGPQPHHHEAWGGHWIVPLVLLLLFLALAAWVFFSARRNAGVSPAAVAVEPAQDPALTELRLRYARGEVTREQFIAADADLRGILPPPAPA